MRPAEQVKKAMHDLEISLFSPRSDVVDPSGAATVEHSVYCATAISNVEPVPDVHAVSIDRQLTAFQCVCDHQWDQLLRKLVRAIVVGGPGNNHVQAKSDHRRSRKVFGR